MRGRLLAAALLGCSVANPTAAQERALSLTLRAERERYPLHSPVAFWVVAENRSSEPAHESVMLGLPCEAISIIAVRGSREVRLGRLASGSVPLPPEMTIAINHHCAKTRLDAWGRTGVRVVMALDPSTEFLLCAPGEYRFLARYEYQGVSLETAAVSVTADAPSEDELPAYRAFSRELAWLAHVPASASGPLARASVDQGIAFFRRFEGSIYADGLALGLEEAIASGLASATPEQRSSWYEIDSQLKAVAPRGLEQEARDALTPQLQLIADYGKYEATREALGFPHHVYVGALEYMNRFGGTTSARRVEGGLRRVLFLKQGMKIISPQETSLLRDLERWR